MKFILALFLALVAAATAFVPSTSCRVAITASRTRSNAPLVRQRRVEFEFSHLYCREHGKHLLHCMYT